MQFSVIGLPHYTIWHLYEPSVDDIRHMEEMEQERIAHEKEEEERQERIKKIKDQFADPNGQWEKDKADIQNEALEEQKIQSNKAQQAQADGKLASEAKAAPAQVAVQAAAAAEVPQPSLDEDA